MTADNAGAEPDSEPPDPEDVLERLERQTERTRDVTYEINIELPNLPKEHQTA